MKKYILSAFVTFTSITLLAGVQQNAQAAIFKCVNTQGDTYYNDKACPQTDKETLLNNITDPVGGYIPPAFKADVKDQGSKGVVVGEKTDLNNNSGSSKDISGSEKIGNNGDSDDSSESSSPDSDDSYEDVTENTQSGKTKRIKRKGPRKSPLPTVPLKKEKVTKEPRSKIN